jgi:hypothetical protein
MSILALMTALLGSNWSTTCIMTQSNGLQGYTIDQVSFEKNPTNKNLETTFTRTWFEDQNCSVEKSASTEKASLTVGSRINPTTFEADWNFNQKLELGAIAVSEDGKSLRMATTSFGSSRNTMLSLFSYFSK